MILYKIYLTQDCVFTVEKLKVLKTTKHGKYIGKEKGKAQYEEEPARIWLTDKGRFDSELLDKVKDEKNGFSITTQNTDLTESKQNLKDKLISAFACFLDTLKHRKQEALDKALKSHEEYYKANFALKKAKEIKI